MTVQPNAEASQPTAAPFDFEQDTRTIREWLRGGGVATERLKAEMRRALAHYEAAQPSGDFASVRAAANESLPDIDAVRLDQKRRELFVVGRTMRALRAERRAIDERLEVVTAQRDDLSHQVSELVWGGWPE